MDVEKNPPKNGEDIKKINVVYKYMLMVNGFYDKYMYPDILISQKQGICFSVEEQDDDNEDDDDEDDHNEDNDNKNDDNEDDDDDNFSNDNYGNNDEKEDDGNDNKNNKNDDNDYDFDDDYCPDDGDDDDNNNNKKISNSAGIYNITNIFNGINNNNSNIFNGINNNNNNNNTSILNVINNNNTNISNNINNNNDTNILNSVNNYDNRNNDANNKDDNNNKGRKLIKTSKLYNVYREGIIVGNYEFSIEFQGFIKENYDDNNNIFYVINFNQKIFDKEKKVNYQIEVIFHYYNEEKKYIYSTFFLRYPSSYKNDFDILTKNLFNNNKKKLSIDDDYGIYFFKGKCEDYLNCFKIEGSLENFQVKDFYKTSAAYTWNFSNIKKIFQDFFAPKKYSE